MNKYTISTLYSLLFAFFVLLVGDQGVINLIPISPETKMKLLIALAALIFVIMVGLVAIQLRSDADIGSNVASIVLILILSIGFMSDFTTALIGVGAFFMPDSGWDPQTIVLAIICTCLLFTFMIGISVLWLQGEINIILLVIAGIIFVFASFFDVATSYRGLAVITSLDNSYSWMKSALLVFFSIMAYTCQFILVYLFLEHKKAERQREEERRELERRAQEIQERKKREQELRELTPRSRVVKFAEWLERTFT